MDWIVGSLVGLVVALALVNHMDKSVEKVQKNIEVMNEALKEKK